MTDDTNMSGYCAKDNSETDMQEGCKHPQDYCQHRKSCLIHFMEKERQREKKNSSGGGE